MPSVRVSRRVLLVVSSDSTTVERLRVALDGDSWELLPVDDEHAALREMERHAVDLIVVDVDAAGERELARCTHLRTHTSLGLVALATRYHPPERMVAAVEAGADEFIPYPTERDLLPARLDAVLVRAGRRRDAQHNGALHVGELVINLHQQVLWRSGERIALTKKEWRLLGALAARLDRVVSTPTLLHEVWNGVRGNDSSALRQTVLRLRDKLQDDADAPRYIVNEHGGYRLAIPEPLPTAPPVSTNLPRQVTSFIGRAADIAALATRLREHEVRLVTIVGTAGLGKTELSLMVARQLAPDFPDGVYFVPFADVRDPALIVPTIAQALGIEPGKQSLDKALVAKMQDARVLLVLDNLEHLAEPIAPILGWLIATTVNLKLLASSRVDIRVRGRKRYPLAPLPLPIDTEKDLATLAQIESVTLFLDRVRDVLPAFALAPENASVIAAICRRLNGIPLALELAAARTGQLALPDILQQLDHSLELLVDGPLDVPDRQQTMRGALDWSFALLDDVSRKLFVRLGVFHGGASLAAIAATMGDTTNTAQLPVRLQALVEHSLVQLRHDGDGERYVVLEVIRAYAGERLASEGEEDVVQERHLQYFVQLAADAYTQRDGPDQGVWMGRLAQETDNLRAALQWSIAEQRDEAAQLCQFLWPFWYRTSLFDEGLVWIARTLDARANLDAPLRQQCLLGRGQLLRMLGRYDEAEVALRESAELARQSGDLLRLSEALNYLGFLRGERGDFATSLALLDEALVAARQVGDAMQLAYVLHNLGCTAYNSGDLDTAERSLSEAATRCEQLGDTFGLALALENLGLVARARKDYAAAVGYFTRSSAAYAELQDDTAVAHLQLNLGALALITGDHAEALRRLREALAFFQRTNNQQYLIESLEAIAEVWSKTGRQARALWCWAATDAARQAAGLPQTALDQRRFAAAREHTVSELNANEVAEAQRLGQTTSLDDAAATVVQELSQ